LVTLEVLAELLVDVVAVEALVPLVLLPQVRWEVTVELA
jgi:hypothetical protein